MRLTIKEKKKQREKKEFVKFRKHIGGDVEGQDKISHRPSSDAFSFLTEKSEREFTIRQEELKLKQQEPALRTTNSTNPK